MPREQDAIVLFLGFEMIKPYPVAERKSLKIQAWYASIKF
jgi:hypothetical protein